MTIGEIDLRVGGTWRYVMVRRRASRSRFHGEYREIVPNERIVSTEVYEGIPDADEHAALNTLTLDRDRRPHDAHDPRPAPDEGGPRRAHQLRHGGRHAGRDGPARGGRGLARLREADARVEKPRCAGLFRSRPVSRILSWVTIPLGRRCRRLERRTRSLGGPRQRDLLRLAPDGVWLAAVSPRRWWALTPPFHPYRRRLRRSAPRRSPFCATFRRLSPPGISPASCPAVSGLSSSRRRSGARGHPACTTDCSASLGDPLRRSSARIDLHSGHAQAAPADVQDELAADEALEAGAAQQARRAPGRASGRGRDGHSQSSGTPPSPCRGPATCCGVDRLERAVLGLEPDAAVSRGRSVFTVASSAASSSPTSATTISPFRASSCCARRRCRRRGCRPRSSSRR